MTEMEEMKIATIVQLVNENAARKGISEQVNPDNVVKLPDEGIKDYMGIPHGDIYAVRVDVYVCLVHVYPDGRIHIFFHG